MKKNLARPLVYISLLIVSIVAIQLKKADVISDRTRETVSIPSEIEKHGLPVDIEKVGAVDLNDTLRFTLQPSDNGRQASFYLSRSQVSKVKTGQTVLDAQYSKVIGRISSVASRTNLSNGLFEAWVDLTPNGRKALESFSSANVVINKLKDRLSVSVEAIQFEGNKAFVWVSREGKAQKVEVKLGSLTGGRYEVLDGLKAQDLVVISGHKSLEANAKLRVRNCKGCESEKEVKS